VRESLRGVRRRPRTGIGFIGERVVIVIVRDLDGTGILYYVMVDN
jgi:hypothetical protein